MNDCNCFVETKLKDEIEAEQLSFYRGSSDVTSTSVPNGISNTSKNRKDALKMKVTNMSLYIYNYEYINGVQYVRIVDFLPSLC